MRKKQEEVAKARGWKEQPEVTEITVEKTVNQEKIDMDVKNSSSEVIKESEHDTKANIEPKAEKQQSCQNEIITEQFESSGKPEPEQHNGEREEHDSTRLSRTRPASTQEVATPEVTQTLITDEQVADLEMTEGENHSEDFQAFMTNLNFSNVEENDNGNC